ncbi:MAG: hypothetical protein M1505_01175 [Patescibacteria group bacterium]|nr:hypothetical protein [Patescibacteria group bacterium]MCL5257828.1 hypothetical protein [Patescibacteria group bacterium]
MLDYLNYIFGFFFSSWWLFLPLVTYYIVRDKHFLTVRFNYLGSVKQVHLEVKIPAGVTKTARAMEEVFSSLSGVYRPGNWYRRFIDGFIPPYYIFMLVLHDHRLKFYIRCPEVLKDFVMSRIYSQYPDAIINEVEEPLVDLPPEVPNPTYDIWGSDFKFGHPVNNSQVYPLRTYDVWEKLPEEQQIDPISVISEGSNHISEKEWLIFQIFAMPVSGNDELFGGKWKDEGKKVVDKLIGRKEDEEPGPFAYIVEFMKNLFLAPFTQIEWKVGQKDEKERQWPTLMQHLTPAEKEKVAGVENKISKPGFYSGLRAAYIGKSDVFDTNLSKNRALIFGFLKIFEGFNILIPDQNMITTVSYPNFHYNEKLFFRRKYLYFYLKGEFRPDSLFLLNSEELASLYHVPLKVVPPPGLEREMVKKIPPPPEIPLAEF